MHTSILDHMWQPVRRDRAAKRPGPMVPVDGHLGIIIGVLVAECGSTRVQQKCSSMAAMAALIFPAAMAAFLGDAERSPQPAVETGSPVARGGGDI